MKKLFSFTLTVLYLYISNTASASEPVIDGVLNEESWQGITPNTVNFQVIPQTLTKLEGNFSYQFITSGHGIYIGISASTISPLRVRTQENDTLFTNDHIQLMIDMNNTQQIGYVFAVNHQGYFYDGIYKQNKEFDLDWDSQWHYKTKVLTGSWNAEIFIPWSAMPFSIQDKNEFGFSITRYDESTNATYSSIPANASMNSFLTNFTRQTVEVKDQSSLDIFPYISLNRDFTNSKDKANIGAEIFWKPTKNQQFSATINPDFGQVESNELVVNFSAIENFFSENRPFFNDNSSLFDVVGPESLRVVHTPRIGGNSYYDNDYEGELNSAIKYTLSNERLDLGVLTAFENADQGKPGREFWLLRGQYRFGANKIGMSLNRVDTPSIERKATIIESDFNYAYSDNAELNFGVIKSVIEQSLSTTNDFGWWVTGSIQPTAQQNHEFSLFGYGDNLQLNDIGYVKRVNRKQAEYEYQYQIPDFNHWSIRDTLFSFEAELKTNHQNETLPSIAGVGIEIVTQAEFEYQLSVEVGTPGYDDLLTRGNNSVRLPSFYIAEFELHTAEYDWGSIDLSAEFGTEGLSGKFYSTELTVDLQVSKPMNIGFTFSQYNSESWLEWERDNYIGEFDFTEQAIEINLDYQISETQELRIKLESVIGKANLLNSYLIDPQGQLVDASGHDDFSFSESAFQLRYKYSLSKITAFYLSYSFGGEFEDELAKFGKRNLYKKSIETKDAHNLFAKIRIHF